MLVILHIMIGIRAFLRPLHYICIPHGSSQLVILKTKVKDMVVKPSARIWQYNGRILQLYSDIQRTKHIEIKITIDNYPYKCYLGDTLAPLMDTCHQLWEHFDYILKPHFRISLKNSTEEAKHSQKLLSRINH